MNGKQRHEPGSLSDRRCMLHLNTIEVTHSGKKLGDYTRFPTTSLVSLKKSLPSQGPYPGPYLGKRLCFQGEFAKLVATAALV
jgi:hypothetical protein